MHLWRISSCSPALTPLWIVKQDFRSATCQLAGPADTATLVLKWIPITVSQGKQALRCCPRRPLPGMGAGPTPAPSPLPPPLLLVYNAAV